MALDPRLVAALLGVVAGCRSPDPPDEEDDSGDVIRTAYPDGPPTSDPDDWIDCRVQDRLGVDPDDPADELGQLLASCTCTRDTVRLAAAIRGLPDPEDPGLIYESDGVVDIDGPLYLGLEEDYPDGAEAAGACKRFLWGPRIDDDVELRGVDTGATLVGGAVAVWTPSLYGEDQAAPAVVVLEGLHLTESGPAVQTGGDAANGWRSYADVTLRDLVVDGTRPTPGACPASAYQLLFHHRGTLVIDGVSTQATIDPDLPLPDDSCGLPKARALGIAIGNAEALTVEIADSSVDLGAVSGTVAVYAILSADTSLAIDDTTLTAGGGVFARRVTGELSLTGTTLDVTGGFGLSVDEVGTVTTSANQLVLDDSAIGFQLGPATAAATSTQDVLTGTSIKGYEVSGVGHLIDHPDLSGLTATTAIELTAASSDCTVTGVDASDVTDLGTDNDVVP